MAAEFKIILSIDSQGNAKIEEVKRGLEGIGETAEKAGASADSGFSGAMRSAAALAATVITAAAAYQNLVDVIQTGMRVETLSVVMNQIGKNTGISTQALQYFKKEVESTGVTGMEAMSALSKAMTLGLNLNQMKEFTTRVRDVAVSARDAAGNLMNTSRTVNAVMHGIQSGQVEVLRNLGVTVRGTEEVYKAYAKAIGKTKDELNDAQKAQAMMNEFMRASVPLAGSAAAADETVGKQLASMARYSEEAKVALWDIFSPGMMAGVQTLTQGFKDVKTWAEANSLELRLLGQTIGEYVSTAGTAALETAKWLAVNKDLVITLGELYIITRVISWAAGLANAFGIAAAAGTALAGSIFAIVTAASGLGVLGAIKSFQGKGDTGQGIGSPGTATMGDDMWEYANQKEGKSFDIFQKDRTQRLKNMLGGGQTYISKMSDALNLSGSVESGYASAEVNVAAAKKLAEAGGAGKAGKGGKGRDTSETLENLILQLRQEEAKLADGAFSGIDAWYTKITEKIKKLAMDQDQLDEGLAAAKENRIAKEGKIRDDLEKKYLAATHQTSALQLTEDLKRIHDVEGHEAEAGKAREIMYQHAQERSDKLALAENQQQKTYYDSLASASILIKDQVFWKEQSWQLEKKISQAQLEQWFIGKDITAAQKDDYRAMLSLTNASKEYNLSRQKAVDLGTLEGWAIERAGDALKRSKTSIKDTLTGIEGYFQDALAQGIQGALTGQKKSFKEIGVTIVQSMVLELGKKSFTQIWDNIAKLIAGPPKDTAGGGLSAIPAFGRKAGIIGDSSGKDYAFEMKQLKAKDKFLDKMYKDESKDLGGIRKLKNQMFKEDMKGANAYSDMQDKMIDQNQDLFKASYLTEYQASFTGMVEGITGVWQVGQGLMSAAGASGEAQRIAGIAGFAMQGISILAQFAKSAILMEAWQAAAAAFKSAMAGLPFPVNAVVAPIFAAATFAAVAAMGAFGGGMGGGATGASQSASASAGGSISTAEAAIYHSGGIVAHSGLLVAHGGLNLDERLIKAQVGEWVINKDTTAEYVRQGISFDMVNTGRLPVLPAVGGAGGGDNRQLHISVGDIVINPPAGMTDRETQQMVRRQIWPVIEHELRNRGLSLLR